MKNELVSIIIPVYNSEKYIQQCLKSCSQQTYSNIEIIAVNDGSTDNSACLLDCYATFETRLKVIHQKNQGVTIARRTAVDTSKGEWIFFLDSDDTIEDYTIEHLINTAHLENADLVIGNFNYIDEKGKLIRTQINRNENGNHIQSALQFKITSNLWGRLIKRTLFNHISWASSEIKIGEDIVCGIQLIKNSSHTAILNENIYNYIQYANSTMNLRNPEKVESMLLYIDCINNFFKDGKYSVDANYFVLKEYYAYLMYGGKDYSNENIKNIYKKIEKKELPWKIRIALTPILGKVLIKLVRLLK